MPVETFELGRLTPSAFEHMANMLAMEVLGAGHTGFGPGADGGRDGFFEGSAPYPSLTNQWQGTWYIQSKFRSPNTPGNQQSWLLDQIRTELDEFNRGDSGRQWPDNWIIVTNVDATGVPETGSFDRARALVNEAHPELRGRFHIWGGRKVLDLLARHEHVARYYSEFITSGHVLSAIYNSAVDANANIADIIRYLLVTQFTEQQYTKLEQAGSATEGRPGIHRLFTDLPFTNREFRWPDMTVQALLKASAQNHSVRPRYLADESWREWNKDPRRARIWFVKGGPGNGKSTLTQYLSQVNRASFLLAEGAPNITPTQRSLAQQFIDTASLAGLVPEVPRLPVYIELRQYAHWFGSREKNQSSEALTYLTETIALTLGQAVQAGTLKRAFGAGKWLFVFDGLDEVPGDVKDNGAKAIRLFVDDVLVGCDCDALTVCTSRPQGYSGQFDLLDCTVATLAPLLPDEALRCAKPVLDIDRSVQESNLLYQLLQQAIASPSIQEIMTTPLQCHIMAVVIRAGGRAPERKWLLYSNFYKIIKAREANRDLPDLKISKLLREEDKLLKTLHNRLGFELHSRAERSDGAQTSLSRDELRGIVVEIVSTLKEDNIEETISTLMEATTERLVLVNTPESGASVRFDIRPLQEFFAAEYIYETAPAEHLADRLSVIAGDTHWREVMHFLVSALVEGERHTDLSVAVEALSSVDDTASDNLRTLHRRQAVAGILTSRLLKEGVLESDKRIRQRFRKCLLPLLASPDAPRFLLPQKYSQTGTWLQSVLFDAVMELSEAESVGAAATCLLAFDDEHPRRAELELKLLHSSPEYISAAFLATKTYTKTGLYTGPRWSRAFAIKQLCSEDWLNFDKKTIEAISELFNMSRDNITDATKALGYSDVASNILATLISLPFRNVSRTERHSIDRYRCITEHVNEPPEAFRELSFNEATWAELEASQGIMRFTASVLGAVVGRAGAAERLSTYPVELLSSGSALPRVLLDFFDTGTWSSAYKADRSIVDSIRKTDVGCSLAYSIMPSTRKARKSDLELFCKEMPFLALILASDPSYAEVEKLRSYVSSTSGTNVLYNALIQTGRQVEGSVSVWGSDVPEVQAVLEKLRDVQFGPLENDAFYHRGMTPFMLRLPSEKHLLPVVLGLILLKFEGARAYTYQEDIRGIVAGFIGEPQRLDEVLSLPIPENVRSAALVLSAIMGSVDERCARPSFERALEQYAKGYDITAAAVLSLMVQQCAKDNLELADSLGDRLLEACQPRLETRMVHLPMIDRWREISRSPVTAAKDQPWW